MVGRVISWHLSNSSINSILKKFQYSSIPFHSNGQTPPWYGRMIHSYSLHGDELREYHHRGRLMYRKRIRYSLSSAAGPLYNLLLHIKNHIRHILYQY